MSKFVQKPAQTLPAKLLQVPILIGWCGRANFVQIYKCHTRNHPKITSKQYDFRNNWRKTGHNPLSLVHEYSKRRIIIHFLQFYLNSYIINNSNIRHSDFL